MEIYRGAIEMMEQKATEQITRALIATIRSQGTAVFGIPGGRSVEGVFRLLRDAEIPWERVRIFFVDERVLPLGDNNRNEFIARRWFIDALIENGKLPEARFHIFAPDFSAPDRGADAYTVALEQYGGRFDVLLLGVGEDGHTASLFPEHPALGVREQKFVYISGAPKPPSERVSASTELIRQAAHTFLLFFGKEKLGAFEEFSNSKTDVEHCPAKLVVSSADPHVFVGAS